VIRHQVRNVQAFPALSSLPAGYRSHFTCDQILREFHSIRRCLRPVHFYPDTGETMAKLHELCYHPLPCKSPNAFMPQSRSSDILQSCRTTVSNTGLPPLLPSIDQLWLSPQLPLERRDCGRAGRRRDFHQVAAWQSGVSGPVEPQHAQAHWIVSGSADLSALGGALIALKP
jgi:hypothetical protein